MTVCCYCDNQLSCAVCGREQPDDDAHNLEALADAIDAARFAHPQNPRERPRAFADADPSDREYAARIARAVQCFLKNGERP